MVVQGKGMCPLYLCWSSVFSSGHVNAGDHSGFQTDTLRLSRNLEVREKRRLYHRNRYGDIHTDHAGENFHDTVVRSNDLGVMVTRMRCAKRTNDRQRQIILSYRSWAGNFPDLWLTHQLSHAGMACTCHNWHIAILRDLCQSRDAENWRIPRLRGQVQIRERGIIA